MLALKQISKIEYPKVWRPILQRVVLEMQADIRTTEALCAALAHDDTDAGRVLEKLLDFLPRSIRVDGAIWKADGYWWTDHRINYRKMVRARRNLMPVMASWKQKAQGAPTWHYQLDPDALVLRLAQTLDCSTIYVRSLILQNQNVENPAESAKNAKSITFDSESDSSGIDSSKSKTVTEIAFMLAGEGLTAKAAAEFEGMNPATVKRVIETGRELEKAGKIRKSKAAFLVTALRREQGKSDQSEDYTNQSSDYGPGTDLIPSKRNLLDELEARVDEKYRNAWAGAKDQLRWQLDRATFDTWLADVRVIGFEGDCFVLAVRNERALEMCRERLYRSVKRLLQDASGSAVEVRFELIQQQAVNHVD